MDQIDERVLNPWWFALFTAVLAGVGYFTDGRLGAVEGAVVSVILAHGALLEVLRHERNEREKQDQARNTGY